MGLLAKITYYNRLKADSRECKILCDVEDVHGLTCLINRPTRVTDNSQTLLDVILTNSPKLFQECGVYNPEISDHAAVHGLMSAWATHHPSKVVSFRSFKNLKEDELLYDFESAPWHVGDIFDC